MKYQKLLRHVLQFLITFLCITFLAFLLVYLAPSDAAEIALSRGILQYTQEELEAMPGYLISLLFIYYFALKLGLFSVIGSTADWHSVILPAASLSIGLIAPYTRQIRAVVAQEAKKLYVLGARSRGASDARLSKSLVSGIKHNNYLHAARLNGASTGRIVLHYIIPNILSPIVVTGVQEIGRVILSMSALSSCPWVLRRLCRNGAP